MSQHFITEDLAKYISLYIEQNLLAEFFLGYHCYIKFDVSIRAYQNNVSEKAIAPHSSTLAWKIPWTEQPGRLTGLSDFTFTFHFHALEKEMATHSRG